MNNNLMVMAAGVSSRMKRSAEIDGSSHAAIEALSKPKMMLNVGGRPFLDYLLFNARDAGYSDILFIVSDRDDTIRNYYTENAGDEQFRDLTFSFAEQTIPEGRSKPLGTADAVLAGLGAAGIDPGIVHAANSAGTIAFPDAHRSMVRVGISLFGVAPSPDLAATVDGLGLRLVGSLRSEVVRVAVVEPGETVSYGRRWQADRPTRVATVPIGYADGVPRAWWERGAVLVGGRRRPIRGVVTMDQLMVEVDDDVEVGDEVVLLGSQGEACVRPEEVADAVGSIAYEVLTSVGARVPRRH